MTISPERLDVLQLQWVRLLEPLGVEPAAAYPVFDRIVAAYRQPTRHYHNLEHLVEVHKVAGRLSNESTDPAALMIAVWFHDIVYDPMRQDNEEQSAAIARTELTSLGWENQRIEAVVRLIQATDYRLDRVDPDALLLRDADWAILGAGATRYRRYADAIRAEYGHVRDEEYRVGRTAVLRQFLARPRLYYSHRIFLEAEAAARKNITDEIERLNGSMKRIF